jgi:hypothetical protein
MGAGGQSPTPTDLPREGYPVSIVQEAGWVPGTVWKGTENPPPPRTGIRSVASRYTDCTIPAHHDY